MPFLESLGKSKRLPSIESLEKLWYTLAEEMTELGQVVRFPTTVVNADGNETQQEVVRVGGFNAVSDGRYLAWQPETGKLTELARQPAGSYLASVESFQEETSGMPGFALDPSRGSILAMLVQTPSVQERIAQGGIVGAVILCLGVLGGGLAIVRWLVVFLAGRKVAAQKGSPVPNADNPLGRVLAAYEENRDVDVETLELKLDEVILRESSKLERFLWALKVVGVVAPLLGLLGTVTGMIRTFQLITALRHWRSEDDGQRYLRSSRYYDAGAVRGDSHGSPPRGGREFEPRHRRGSQRAGGRVDRPPG